MRNPPRVFLRRVKPCVEIRLRYGRANVLNRIPCARLGFSVSWLRGTRFSHKRWPTNQLLLSLTLSLFLASQWFTLTDARVTWLYFRRRARAREGGTGRWRLHDELSIRKVAHLCSEYSRDFHECNWRDRLRDISARLRSRR